MITHIAAATRLANLSVERIVQVSRESEAGARHAARACEELSGMALDLQALVGQFELGLAADLSDENFVVKGC